MSNAYLQSIDSTLSAMNLFSLVCSYKNFVINCVIPLCTAVQLVLITARWQYGMGSQIRRLNVKPQHQIVYVPHSTLCSRW